MSPSSNAARVSSRSSEPNALRWLSRGLSCLVLGLGLYATVLSILIVSRYHSSGLWSDQWELVGKLMRTGGKLPLSELWAQHNEHRVPVAWILGLLDLRLFGGRNISLSVEILLVQAAGALLLIAMFRRFSGGRGPILTIAGLALFCAFTPLQMENFTWGFQVTFVLAALAGPAAFAAAIFHSAAVSSDTRRWISLPLVLSLAAAFTAECGLAAGLTVWPILILLGFALRFPVKSQILTATVAIAAVALYFTGYHSPSYHADPLQTLRHPGAIVKYVVTYFGCTWDGTLPSSSSVPTVSELLTGLAILLALAGSARLGMRRKPPADRLQCFLAANMLFAIATAVLTSLGRLSFGIDQATSGRYQTIALLFWASLAAILLVAMTASRRRGFAVVALQIVLALLMLSAGPRYMEMEQFAQDQRDTVAAGYAALVNPHPDLEALHNLYPKPELLDRYSYLRSHGLGAPASEVARQGSHDEKSR
jgi:hypothetical protein